MEQPQKMTLRSSKPIENKNTTETIYMPFIKYTGKISYVTKFWKCAAICDDILQTINKTQNDFIIGFDMEWPFSFQTGAGKTSVIQMSCSLDECFIFQVFSIKCLPSTMTAILLHERVRLVGVNIKNDIRKLSRDFPGIDADGIINNCIDLSTLANSVSSLKQRWSLEKLVNYFLKNKINKDSNVRRSKWNVVPLSEKQLTYAATDTYASLKLYFHLMKESTLKNESD